MPIDLTPFGFTATESLAYGALLELGPSSGYAVAKLLSIARANAYQALDGLVVKQAVVLVAAHPRRYRAVQPQTLLTVIVGGLSSKLDRLERQVATQPAPGAEPLIRLEGTRAIRDSATRAIVRADGEVLCVGPAAELQALGPAFRARAAAGRAASVWSVGGGTDLRLPLAGNIPMDSHRRHFPEPVLLLVADGALLASVDTSAVGFWSTHPLIQGAVRASIAALTS
jgi:hypothetical protein